MSTKSSYFSIALFRLFPKYPSTVSLSCRPWAVVYVDGVNVGQKSTLPRHALSGGSHEIKLVCTQRENRTKTYRVDIDGDDVKLGCWDFDTMGPCEL